MHSTLLAGELSKIASEVQEREKEWLGQMEELQQMLNGVQQKLDAFRSSLHASDNGNDNDKRDLRHLVKETVRLWPNERARQARKAMDGFRSYPDDVTAKAGDVLELVEELKKAKGRGAKQGEAVSIIAKWNDGYINVADAQRLLVDSGFMVSTKNAPYSVHKLVNDRKRFTRVARGQYRVL